MENLIRTNILGNDGFGNFQLSTHESPTHWLRPENFQFERDFSWLWKDMSDLPCMDLNLSHHRKSQWLDLLRTSIILSKRTYSSIKEKDASNRLVRFERNEVITQAFWLAPLSIFAMRSYCKHLQGMPVKVADRFDTGLCRCKTNRFSIDNRSIIQLLLTIILPTSSPLSGDFLKFFIFMFALPLFIKIL